MVIEKQEPLEPIVGVDMDRTIVDDQDELLPGAKEALVRLRAEGWKIIIWTARSDLDEVRQILGRDGVPFDYINENPEIDRLHYSRKVFFDATVDDKAVPFAGNWPEAVAELERRRVAWRAKGTTKTVRLMGMDDGNPKTLAEFALEDDKIVERTGVRSRSVEKLLREGLDTHDGMVYPSDGQKFLRALAGLQGTYLWAESL